MTRQPLLDPNGSYTFSNYFELGFTVIDSPQTEILGAVTTGNVWQFGVLDRQGKSICEGINLYRVTEQLEIIIRILLAKLV
ncbi:hypothetical protein [Umezakia ovalisporum]|jgi:hypothetical protein|uniref:hypothetical protein n=1 Tax=Umezakia ovalisporum TaxID=75695 RepID=UPI0035B748B5|nr:hypothetical protein [Nostoc sp. RI_552]